MNRTDVLSIVAAPLIRERRPVRLSRINAALAAAGHFAASFMILNGLPVTDVAALLGHRKFDTTLQIYAHPITSGYRRTETVDRMAQTLLLPD
ncbi:hypothetical protein [Azospirillum brasilense]|uniref:hypothetical protein n=1 Tax=Azospirillum brasilense TaxID=192 RepID=UPI0003A4B2FE|nr:hypothetical protein [Azospirillum brasilense]